MHCYKLLLLCCLVLAVYAKHHHHKRPQEDKAELAYVVKAIEKADRYAEKKGLSKMQTKELEENAAKKAIKEYAQMNSKRKSDRRNREHYAWLKKVVRNMEDKINSDDDVKIYNPAKDDKKIPYHKRRYETDPFLRKIEEADRRRHQEIKYGKNGVIQNTNEKRSILPGSNQEVLNSYEASSSTSYPVFKEDISWSGWFWSFFGYPTRIQLDPSNELTMYLIQNSNKDIVADPKIGLYVRVTDKKK